jgi:hypothetical protein
MVAMSADELAPFATAPKSGAGTARAPDIVLPTPMRVAGAVRV